MVKNKENIVIYLFLKNLFLFLWKCVFFKFYLVIYVIIDILLEYKIMLKGEYPITCI